MAFVSSQLMIQGINAAEHIDGPDASRDARVNSLLDGLKNPLCWGILDHDLEEETPMVLVKAKVVDSTHLELSKPIAARKRVTVLVSVHT